MTVHIRCADPELRRRIRRVLESGDASRRPVPTIGDGTAEQGPKVVVVETPEELFPAFRDGADVVVTADRLGEIAQVLSFAAAGGRGVLGVDASWLGLSDVEGTILRVWHRLGTGEAVEVGYSARHVLRILDGLAERFDVPTRQGLALVAVWLGV